MDTLKSINRVLRRPRALLVGPAALMMLAAYTSGALNLGAREASPRAIAIQPDGKIVLAGTAGVGKVFSFALARYTPDGVLDPAFGNGGRITTWFRGTPTTARYEAGSWVRSIFIQPDGKLVAGGVASMGGGWTVNPFLYGLARYNSDGTLDAGFGKGGTVTTDLGWVNWVVPSFALQADGKLILVGDASVDHGKLGASALVRYLANGDLDPEFGEGGKILAFRGTPNAGSPRAVIIQPDHKIVVAGRSGLEGKEAFGLARYLPNGSLDDTFGHNGAAVAAVSVGAKSGMMPALQGRGPFALVLQPDGKLIVAGASDAIQGRIEFAVIRFLPDGSPDTGFGINGAATMDFGDDSPAYALVLQPDGRIIVAGAAGSGEFQQGRFALARFLSDGKPDLSFGTGGRIVSNFGQRGIQALGLLADGKLVAAGPLEINHVMQFGLARYLSDGELDSSFGVNGLVTTEFPAPAMH